jgi:ubiquinone/menaquinone biosynthesis C-methylase UbiE
MGKLVPVRVRPWAHMVLTLPAQFEKKLHSFLKQQFYPGTRWANFKDQDWNEKDLNFFSSGVSQLHRAFTQESRQRPKNYFNKKELRSGYFLYFLPVNALKIMGLLHEIPQSHWNKYKNKPLRILDLGMGPGSGVFGALFYFQKLIDEGKLSSSSLQFFGLDQSKGVLNEAKRLYQLYNGNMANLETKVADFSRGLQSIEWPDEPFDLIIAANTLNEIPRPEQRLKIIQSLKNHALHPEGLLLVMEPALQKNTRDLMELKDEILAKTSLKVIAPCLHQSACPMLTHNARDWCHAYLEWKPSPTIQSIDQIVGIKKDHLKCSYFFFSPTSLAGLVPVHNSQHFRVVSSLLKSKGKTECLFCGPQSLPQLLRVTRLNKESSSHHQGWERLKRGDIVGYSGAPRLGRQDSLNIKKVI